VKLQNYGQKVMEGQIQFNTHFYQDQWQRSKSPV